MRPTNVLIACEFSGIVRDAFIRRGHNAVSCDLLPTEQPGPHFQQDIFDADGGWAVPGTYDLIIAHPPCTHLSVSGARWWKTKQVEQRKSIWFFMAMINAPAPMVCVENPVGLMSRLCRKPEQIIQPWQFGEDASKKTCLWLKGLPLLKPTKIIEKTRYANQTASGQNRLAPSPTRWKDRSRTYVGVAEAMAEQWGAILAESGVTNIQQPQSNSTADNSLWNTVL